MRYERYVKIISHALPSQFWTELRPSTLTFDPDLRPLPLTLTFDLDFRPWLLTLTSSSPATQFIANSMPRITAIFVIVWVLCYRGIFSLHLTLTGWRNCCWMKQLKRFVSSLFYSYPYLYSLFFIFFKITLLCLTKKYKHLTKIFKIGHFIYKSKAFFIKYLPWLF